MSINYCDYLNGDDDSGDGSAENPYKTIYKASDGLTGGDEARVAKSGDPISLSGTLTWTDGSATVATSVDLTGEVAVGDFIGKGTVGETYWRVADISSTEITLGVPEGEDYSETKYYGVSEVVASKKLAFILAVDGQAIEASGVSKSNRLKVSGGWDLTSELQTGVTWFSNFGGSEEEFTGLQISGNYVEVDKINFIGLQGNGLEVSGLGHKLSNMTCNAMLYKAGFIVATSHTELYNINACQNDVGICFGTTGRFSTVDPNIVPPQAPDPQYVYADVYGENILCLSNHKPNMIVSHVTRLNLVNVINLGSYNPDYDEGEGIEIDSSPNCIFTNLTNRYHYGDSLVIDELSSLLIINKYIADNENITIYTNNDVNSSDPIVSVQHLNIDKNDKTYFLFGTIDHIIGAEARGASGDAIRFTPTSADNYVQQYIKFQVDSGVGKSLKIYMKKSSDFDGDVQAAVYFMGKKVTDWTTLTMTTDYVQQSINASSGDITEDGVVELRIRVRGTIGYVYADDISSV